MSGSGMNGIPGANAMGDTLAFVKNLWGSMKIPGMAMPSMSPEEIDKQIADLKAVESWLQMNMNMLRGSIQALEVQSATLSALRSMSETFAQAASGVADAAGAAGAAAASAASAAASAADDKPHFESPFASARTHEAEPTDAESNSGHQGSHQAGHQADAAGMGTPFANPAVWWNAVQDQFQQAVSHAMAPAPVPAKKKAARKSGTAKKKPAASKGASKGAGSAGGANRRAGSSANGAGSSNGSSQRKQGSTMRRRRKPGESA